MSAAAERVRRCAERHVVSLVSRDLHEVREPFYFMFFFLLLFCCDVVFHRFQNVMPSRVSTYARFVAVCVCACVCVECKPFRTCWVRATSYFSDSSMSPVPSVSLLPYATIADPPLFSYIFFSPTFVANIFRLSSVHFIHFPPFSLPRPSFSTSLPPLLALAYSPLPTFLVSLPSRD